MVNGLVQKCQNLMKFHNINLFLPVLFTMALLLTNTEFWFTQRRDALQHSRFQILKTAVAALNQNLDYLT